jgi:hypothetical protein
MQPDEVIATQEEIGGNQLHPLLAATHWTPS